MIYGDGHCAACPHSARKGQLMCSTCWAKVPGTLRIAVLRANDRWAAGILSLGALREAQNEAIKAAGGRPKSGLL